MYRIWVLLTISSAAAYASDIALPRVVWEQPKALTLSDWSWGPGGQARAPRPPFRFVKEDAGGTNAKVEVTDARGATWTVKFGGETRAETFASRLLYAAGYPAEPVYFVPSGMIEGVHGLKRARPFIHRDGRFRDARFKLRDARVLEYADEFTWSWTDNPFLGSHEFSGLKILMMLTSNWDAKDARDGAESNTAVFVRHDSQTAEYIYAFTDWGSSFGRWGGFFKRTRWDAAAFESQTRQFVSRDQSGRIVWGYTGKHGRDVSSGITIDDIRWLLPYLSRISEADLRAGLAGSGASAPTSARLAQSLLRRISELESVAGTTTVTASSR